jgi:hypothetical protein
MAQRRASWSIVVPVVVVGLLAAGIALGLHTHLIAQRAMTGVAVGRIVGFRDFKGRIGLRPYGFGFPPGAPGYVVIYEYAPSRGAPAIHAHQRVDEYAFNASGLRVGSTVAVRYDPEHPDRSQFVISRVRTPDRLGAA